MRQTAKKAANLMDVEELIKGYFHYQSLQRHCWLQMETEPKAKIDCNLRLTLILIQSHNVLRINITFLEP